MTQCFVFCALCHSRGYPQRRERSFLFTSENPTEGEGAIFCSWDKARDAGEAVFVWDKSRLTEVWPVWAPWRPHRDGYAGQHMGRTKACWGGGTGKIRWHSLKLILTSLMKELFGKWEVCVRSFLINMGWISCLEQIQSCRDVNQQDSHSSDALYPLALVGSERLKHKLTRLTQKTKAEGGMSNYLALRTGFSPLTWDRGPGEWAAISAMHQIAQWRGREAHRASSVTTRRSLCSRVSFGTCVLRAGERADGWWEGGSEHTGCPFRPRAPIICTVMSLGDQEKRLERNSWWAGHQASETCYLTHWSTRILTVWWDESNLQKHLLKKIWYLEEHSVELIPAAVPLNGNKPSAAAPLRLSASRWWRMQDLRWKYASK